MRWLIVGGFVWAFVVGMRLVAASDEWTISTKYHDSHPGDGLFEAGTIFNPYVATPPGGTLPQGTIRARYHDLTPNDGVWDAGSWVNPYVYRENE